MNDLKMSEDVFEACPGFYLSDNRKNRPFNPVTEEMLKEKLNVLLPPAFIKGKSILDLGSCLGAAGQWALYHGAASYVGVELQEKYATESKKMLGFWGARACVYQKGIREFLDDEKEKSYDIVLMAGVLYLFVDPLSIIEKMCKMARLAVVVETNYSPSIRAGKISSRAAITEYIYDQEVNLANGNESLLGISSTSSPKALDLMFGLNGFKNDKGKLDFPVNENMLNYSNEGITKSIMPLRYAVCYMRKPSMVMAPLEKNISKEKGLRRSWQHNAISKARTIERGKLRQTFSVEAGSWQFDERVADDFFEIANREIPDYQRVIDKTVEVINKCDFHEPKIIDVGSALGETLKRLHTEGYRNIYGVDNSEAMIKRSFKKATLIHSHQFPMNQGPFDVIIANWVLHFIAQREAYLKCIKNSLNHDGILIITEKLVSSSLTHSIYDDFKRNNGLSFDEIKKKRRQLEGVLTPNSLSWYMNAFETVGFGSVDIINANTSFVTFLIKMK